MGGTAVGRVREKHGEPDDEDHAEREGPHPGVGAELGEAELDRAPLDQPFDQPREDDQVQV